MQALRHSTPLSLGEGLGVRLFFFYFLGREAGVRLSPFYSLERYVSL